MPDRLRRQRRHARLENPQATAPVPVTAGRQPAARGLLALCLLAAVPLCIGLAVSVVLFLLVSVSLYARFAGTLPAGYRLDAGQLSQSTKIYDRRGTLLYEVFDPQGGKRTLVTAEQLPQTLKQAVVATEDSSFYSNWGIDPVAILRAVYYDLRYGRAVSGGSTITQQLAKNLFLSTDPTLERKIREAVIAIELTRRYPKDQILAAYLNSIYFGNLAYGVEAAAEAYFAKDVSGLDLAESSLLAGLPQAPALYDPCADVEAALGRQQTVLSLMQRAGYIDQAAADAAGREMSQRLHSPDFANRCSSPATANAQPKAPHFVNYVRAQLEQQYGPEVMYRGGLQVTTTLDLNLQSIVEEEAKNQIGLLHDKNATNAAVVVMDPHTGEILAMLGSVDFNDQNIAGQVNVADRLRQPGSAIKPINYVTAFSQGWSPATPLYDLQTNFPNGANPPFVPGDYDGKQHGLVTARVALASSLNIPAVKTLYFTSQKNGNDMPQPLAMIETAKRLGITTFGTGGAGTATPQPFGLALTLGGGDVKLIELTGAYAVFANQGSRVPPVPYVKITDGQGQVLFDLHGRDNPRARTTCALFDPGAPNEQPDLTGACVHSAPYAYLITSILSDDAAREIGFGRNSSLKLSRPAAVKTGTTNDFRDNWTIGYTPDLVVGVWVGNSNNTPMKGVTGISGAAPIWHNVMERALQNTPSKDFAQPPGLTVVEVCHESGLPASDLCPPDHRHKELFVAGHLPAAQDDSWQQLNVCGHEDLYQVPPHDVGDLIPYDQILNWARSAGWKVAPAQDVPCYNPPAVHIPGVPPGKHKRKNDGNGSQGD